MAKVQFKGSIAPVKTAIKISGNGDGGQVTIDIPESEMAELLKLSTLRQVVLIVTLETDATTEEY